MDIRSLDPGSVCGEIWREGMVTGNTGWGNVVAKGVDNCVHKVQQGMKKNLFFVTMFTESGTHFQMRHMSIYQKYFLLYRTNCQHTTLSYLKKNTRCHSF